MSKSTVRHYTTTGRFNLLSDSNQQQVVLITPAGTVSTLWPDGEAPYDADMLPSEVSQNIRARVMSYLYSSGRPETLAKLDAIDARADEFDREFALYRADFLDNEARKIQEKAAAFRRNAAMLDPPKQQTDALMDNLGFPSIREQS
jgi:hypothetical protein